MAAGTRDDQYLVWLYQQVAILRPRRSSKTHWDLLRKLYSTEYTWFVPNDDNRAEDGRALRNEWEDSVLIGPDYDWLSLECSVLEMLVALSRRLSFEADGEPADWFWHMIDNLGLTGMHDRAFSDQFVEDRVTVFLERTYEKNGLGGLFPLRDPHFDQREVELWYQLCEYVMER